MEPSARDDLIHCAGIAELLGVSYERVRQITHTDPSFPPPVETKPYRR